MPILHSPGVIIPGQFGPIKRVLEVAKRAFTSDISRTGIPSVMAITKGISASIASRMESAAKGGGTYMAATLAPSLSTDSWTVSNTGTES